MLRYIIRRLLIMIPLLLAITIIVFAMVRFIPGDPALVLAGFQASTEQVEIVRARLGLDKPAVVQYFLWMKDMLRGDLGTSMRSGQPVISRIKSSLPKTLILSAAALFIAGIVGISAGVISGIKQYSVYDYFSSSLVLVGISAPVFWLALLLMLLFSLTLGWLPASGSESIKHLILPAVSVAANITAFITRMTRSSILEVMRQDYVRTARAKGLRERIVLLRHVLKNAFIPVVTVIGLLVGNMIGGTVLVETVFSWPGIGRLLVDSILQRDYPIIQAVVLIYALLFALVNLLVDITYAYLDPRISYA